MSEKEIVVEMYIFVLIFKCVVSKSTVKGSVPDFILYLYIIKEVHTLTVMV